jgi:hypothetical protein
MLLVRLGHNLAVILSSLRALLHCVDLPNSLSPCARADPAVNVQSCVRFPQLGFRQPPLSYPRQHVIVVVFVEFANARLPI